MSEKLLNALMELFAIIANINDLRDKGQHVVKEFLQQQLNSDAVDDYVEIFNQYFEKHSGGKKKRTPVSHSVQGLVICSQINETLTQAQKLTILVRLLEFINLDEEITEDELDFVETVGLAFNFEEAEYLKIKNYIIENDTLSLDYPEILIVDQNDAPNQASQKHIKAPHISGYLSFFRVASLDMYLISMKSEDEIMLNGIPMKTGLIYTFVNGSTLRGNKLHTLYFSDVVSSFLSELDEEKVLFKGENITYVFPGNRIGLHDINFAEESGKLVGIMGASGAGKTTLLNVFSGISKPTHGDVTINGKSLYSEEDSGKGLIGLIAQDDLLFEELTVYQNLFYNAQLCLGGLSDEEIDELVNKVLKSLGLYEIKDLTVGSPLNKKISGGQRKRLNIGLELIREPKVLFVDEPTSGLSSRDSENIMDLLKELTLKGKLVIVVIHQPSSDIFKMFDKLLILDTGGYPAYYGNPIDAVSYFKEEGNYLNSDKNICSECGNINPEQIFNIIEAKVVNEYGQFTDERKTSPKRWNEIFLEKFTTPQIDIDFNVKLNPAIIPGKLKQLQVFIKRDVLSKLSNTQYLLFTFTEAPLLAFILAYLVRYYDVDEGKLNNAYVFSENSNMVAYIFMSVVVALFLGMIVSAEEIIKDQKIKKRESFLNLSKGSYFFSKVLILFTISAIQTLTYIVLGNWILDISGMNFNYWLILFSTSCFANMLGLNISATFNSAVTIYILIPILLIPQLMLSGAIVKFDKLNPSFSSATHVPVVGDMIASKWAFEAIAVTQFKDNEYEKMFYDKNKVISKLDFKINYIIPKLRTKIDYNEKYATTDNDSIKNVVDNNFELLRNEFAKMKQEVALDFDENILRAENFSKKNAGLARAIVYKYKKFCNKSYNKVYDQKDGELWALQKTPEQKKAFIAMKEKYYNEDIADLVKNSNDENRLIEVNKEYIQKIDPVYLDPYVTANAVDFRAHLFAPRKTMFGKWFDTVYFNASALWAMTLILYVFLYFGVFSIILNKIELLFARLSEKMSK